MLLLNRNGTECKRKFTVGRFTEQVYCMSKVAEDCLEILRWMFLEMDVFVTLRWTSQ